MPSQAKLDARLVGQQATDHISSQLTEVQGDSLGGLVDALFGDVPLLSEPDLPVVPDKWDAPLAAYELHDASVPQKVNVAAAALKRWSLCSLCR